MAGLALQSDLGADDLPGVEQAEQADSEPRTPPPRKRRGRGQRKSGKKPPQPKKTDTMKCKSCNKVKQSSEFYADQLSCKLCNSGKRALLRTADAQGCREAVQKFQSQNPDGFEAMQRAFNKERAEQAKTQGKIKFSCVLFMREWEKREGFRDAQLGEYMWEQEFYEFAGTAKMGFLSKAESQKLSRDGGGVMAPA